MNAQKTGALDSPSQPEGRSVFHFSIDMADDFIDSEKVRREKALDFSGCNSRRELVRSTR